LCFGEKSPFWEKGGVGGCVVLGVGGGGGGDVLRTETHTHAI